MPEVLFSVEPPLAFLTFNRPAARNALTWAMYDGLIEACDTVDARPDLRVLIVRGAGQSFAAGTDISQFTTLQSPEDGIAYERRLDGVIDRLDNVVKTTLAQVEGVAAGGGCAIALTCDLRVCSPGARFGVPVARTLGNCLSAANTSRMIDVLGLARFKDMMLTARLMTVEELGSAGLVTQIADSDRIDAATRELALTVAAHAPLTIEATKEMIRRVQAHRRLAQARGDDLVGRCYGSAGFPRRCRRLPVEAFASMDRRLKLARLEQIQIDASSPKSLGLGSQSVPGPRSTRRLRTVHQLKNNADHGRRTDHEPRPRNQGLAPTPIRALT